jgi:putative ABC transport system permease protein
MTLGPFARLALLLVPRRWRDSVSRDLLDEAGAGRTTGFWGDLWMGWQIVRIALRFLWHRRRLPSETRERRAWNFRTDIRLAWRGFRREPTSTFAIIGTLALGTGAATATYAVMNYAILRPIPGVADERGLVSVFTQLDAATPGRASASFAHLEAMRSQTPALTGLAGWFGGDKAVAVDPAEPPRTGSFVTVTRGFFDVLGVRPRLGRLFTTEEYETTGTNIVVISERFWSQRLARNPAIVGRKILIGGQTFEIIGVARAFHGLDRLRREDGWLPEASIRTLNSARGPATRDAPIQMVGRLAAGASLAAVQSQLTSAFLSAGEFRMGERTFLPFAFAGVTDGIGVTRARVMAVFRVMLAGVALLLILACANAANLTLARLLRRRQDLRVRQALGANRLRLLREHLVEAAALSACAGLFGLALAALLTSLFRSSRLLSYLPVLDDLSLDWRVAMFCGALSVLTILLFALVPAALATRAGLRGSASVARATRQTGWLRMSLVSVQVALSFALVVAAALLAQSVHRLQTMDFGFEPDAVLAFSYRPNRAGYDDAGTAAAMQRLREHVSAVPGVRGVAMSFLPPLGGSSGSIIRLPGKDAAATMKISSHHVTEDYFAVMGIPVTQGRVFAAAETSPRPQAGGPIILNAALARRLFGSVPAVGREILQQGRGEVWQSRTVIGVVGDVVGANVREGFQPFAYEPFGGSRIATVLVRTDGAAAGIADALRHAARAAAPAVPVDDIQLLRVQANEQIAQERVLSRLSLIFGAVAGLLALAGLYASVAQFVGERAREFAIRTAIGATAPQIAGGILRRVAALTSAGLAVGAVILIALTSLLATYLFGVSPRDPLTIAVAAAVLLLAALAAAWPAVRRAVRVDPATALRTD